MNKIIVLVTLVITLYSIASAIEVGGYISEDTIWTPENNPYLVTSGVFVEEDISLTILPGTIVKFDARLLDTFDFGNDFWFVDGIESSAKFIRCEGSIIAEGTEESNITFTRIQDEDYYCWGNIYLPEDAGFASFKFCNFEYAAFVGYSITEQPDGALSIRSGNAKIENCTFLNNGNSIEIQSKIENIEILNNLFSIIGPIHQGVANIYFQDFMIIKTIYLNSTNIPLIANNVFNQGVVISFTYPINFIDNEINYTSYSNPSLWISIYDESSSYIFSNQFNNTSTGIWGSGDEESMANLFIKDNQFIRSGGQGKGIEIDYYNIDINNNYFENCGLDTGHVFGRITNNTIRGGQTYFHGDITYTNNVNYDYNSSSYAISTYQDQIVNNIFVNNYPKLLSDSTDSLFTNCIILMNGDLHWWPIPHGSDTFRNCIIDFPLDPPLIDGGGNIIVDSLQAQEIFVDIENGDFHLAANSMAIDAGFDTLDYYYPFDIENSVRVWDGDNDGNSIIDIGAYEYGAPQLGKITGYIRESISGEPVNYVLLKANDEPGEFTFADSSGYFEIQLPEGTYDLYAERVFYDDNVIYTVTVENEQTTEIEFDMTYNDPLVGSDDNELNIQHSKLNISNYPNPFNPTTTISFNLPSDSDVSVEVYNVKGQKVKTLLSEKILQGQHNVVWNGLNQKNKPVSSGVYFYKVKAENQVSVNRMLLLK